MVNNNFIHHPSKTFSFMVNNNFMIINNNFIHHPSTTSSIKNFFIHDHQQQLHSPLPSTYILTTRLHHMVNTFIIGQLVRTINFMIINKLFHPWSTTTSSITHQKLFHSWSTTTS
jgi:hypothetical protein